MKILALEKDLPYPEGKEPGPAVLEQEARRAWELQQSDQIRELYFRADKDAAVLVLECDSIEQANRILATLPLVREQFIEFELIPLTAYPGFERLFKA